MIDWSVFDRAGAPLCQAVDCKEPTTVADPKKMMNDSSHKKRMTYCGGKANVPNHVRVAYIKEKHRVITLAYVYDMVQQKVYHRTSVYDNRDSTTLPGGFVKSIHRYTALYRLRHGEPMVFDCPLDEQVKTPGIHHIAPLANKTLTDVMLLKKTLNRHLDAIDHLLQFHEGLVGLNEDFRVGDESTTRQFMLLVLKLVSETWTTVVNTQSKISLGPQYKQMMQAIKMNRRHQAKQQTKDPVAAPQINWKIIDNRVRQDAITRKSPIDLIVLPV